MMFGKGGYGFIHLFRRTADAPKSSVLFKNLPFLLVKVLAKFICNNSEAYSIERVSDCTNKGGQGRVANGMHLRSSMSLRPRWSTRSSGSW